MMATTKPSHLAPPDLRWEITTVSAIMLDDSRWIVRYPIRDFTWSISIATDTLPTAPQVADPLVMQLEDNSIMCCMVLGDHVVMGAIPEGVTLHELATWRDTTLALRTYHARPTGDALPWYLAEAAAHRIAIYQAYRAIAACAGDVRHRKPDLARVTNAVAALAAIPESPHDDETADFIRAEDEQHQSTIPPLVCKLRDQEWGCLEYLACAVRLYLRYPTPQRRREVITWQRTVNAYYASYPGLSTPPYDGHPF